MKTSKNEIREQLVTAFRKQLKNLHFDNFIDRACGGGIDEQCQDRFGCSWDELHKRVFNDLESMSVWHRGIAGDSFRVNNLKSSGSWMVNALLEAFAFKIALMNHEKVNEQQLEEFIEKVSNDAELRKSLRWEDSLDRNVKFAPLLVKKEICEMLDTHGWR